MHQQIKPSSAKSPAREIFARRLRSLRIPRGYRTARSFAHALGIDENRYTRYERAEVEPDLGLIQRICELLLVTPNELLGHSDPPPLDTAEGGQPIAPTRIDQRICQTTIPSLIQTSAWQLACGVAALKQSSDSAKDVPVHSPLALYERASPLFEELERRPFDVICRIVKDPNVTTAPPAEVAKIHQLIEGHIGTLHQAAAGVWTIDDC